MNYFELYGIDVDFLPDEKKIKQKYLALSKQFHPDFFATAPTEKQNEMLQLSTLTNKAYRTLNSFDSRMKYILQLKSIIEEEEKYTLPQSFLMEMLELNEVIEENAADADKKSELIEHIKSIENKLYSEIEPMLITYSEQTATQNVYEAIKSYYYKRKYILRLKEQLGVHI